MTSLEFFQSQFKRRSDLIHLNNAGLSPLPKVAFERINYWSQRFYEEGYFADADYMKEVDDSKIPLAQLLSCSASEIAWFVSASAAISQFAFGINLQENDEVVMWDQEYPSMLYPFKFASEKARAKLVIVKSESNLATPTEKFIQAISSKTRAVAFSWIQFSSGARMDVRAVIDHCKQKNILVFIDGMQGIGIHPMDLWQLGADAIVGGSHKWLLGPVGVGFLAIRSSLLKTMKPLVYGAKTFGTCDDPSNFECVFKNDASKFESGARQAIDIMALGASCKMIAAVGVETIEQEALRLANRLLEGLKNLGFSINSPFSDKHLSPMVNFKPKNIDLLPQIVSDLTKNRINFAMRAGGIRFSTQAFNTATEIDFVVSVLKRYTK